ncbi:MAG: hypothetical protein Q4B03_05970 [Lachnospiraceae bacterium]|nr:hypothetical protein [Lachnospiraceae bacterium]
MKDVKVQTMKLNDAELDMVNGGTPCFSLKKSISVGFDCPYNKGAEVGKYDICAGTTYIAYDNTNWYIVIAQSDNYEVPGMGNWLFGNTDTYADFLVLDSTNESKKSRTVKWELMTNAKIYEYLGA